MHITDNSFNISNAVNNSISVNSSSKGQGVADVQSMSGNAQITQTKEGQVFSGQILDITRDQVNILLENNKTLFARLGESLNLNIGDNITFQVKENNGSNVVIKPFSQNLDIAKDSAIFKVLEGNNLSPTAKNYQIAETLMNNNLPVDKTSMQKIMQQSYKFPDTSIDTLVSMNKLGIPVNQENIGQYEAFVSNNHQLVNNINEMSNSISDFSVSMLQEISLSSDNTTGDMLEFNAKLLSIISDEGDLSNFAVKGELQGEMPVNNTVMPTSASSSAAVEGTLLQQAEVPTVESGISKMAADFSVNEENLKAVFDSLSKLGVSEESLVKLTEKSETPLKLLNNINELVSQLPEGSIDSTDIKALFQSEGYREILKEGIKNKFTLDPNKMEDPGEIDELYNKIYEKTNSLMEAFAGKGGNAGEQMSNSAKGMQERIDFMQNLNNMFPYAQIPVKLSGKEMNSELFVYLNKKKLMEKKEDVSALLHLDMDHLGPTDVHVSLRGSMVHTKFYVEDELSAKLLDEHMTILEKAVNETGYSLSNEVITRTPTLNTSGNMVVDEMLGKDLEQTVKRYSFDVRM